MKFCGECGGMLCGSKCPACGFDNNAGMKFCGNCGKSYNHDYTRVILIWKNQATF